MKLSNTDRSEYRLFKIVKQNGQHLVLTDGHKLMLYKTYQFLHPSTLHTLNQREYFKHESLIAIYKVQVGQTQISFQQPLDCGILFQNYSKTLSQTIQEMITFSQEEVFQTLRPIREVLQYFISQNYDPGPLSLDCIVCNDNYEIKFIEGQLHQKDITLSQRSNLESVIFEELAGLIFTLLFPRQKHIKSWKTRYQISEKKIRDPDNFKFVQEVYAKFAPSFLKNQKSKKIKKIDDKICQIQAKRQKRNRTKLQKSAQISANENLQAGIKWQQGKQNKIIQ